MYQKSLFIFLLSIVLPQVVAAQEFRKMEIKPHQKLWEEGSVVTGDFKGEPLLNAAANSDLSYQIGYFPEKIKRPDSTIFRYSAFSFMDRNKSWLNPKANPEQLLKYNQVILNLVEVYERKLQRELNLLTDQAEADAVTSQLFNQLNQETKRLASETRNGEDGAMVAQYLAGTEKQLAEDPASLLPNFSDRNFSYGVHAGFGYSGLTGNMNRYFQNPINLVFGLDAGYKKLVLHLNATQGFSEVKNNFTEARIWPADIRVSVNLIEASAGFRLLHTARLNLIPFAGWAFADFSGSDKNDVYRYHELQEHTFSAGICLDYKLRHRLNFIPGYFGKPEGSETRIRTRLSFIPVQYNDQQKGGIVSLSASLNFGGRMLKVR
ncbi:hypothetical protein I5M27_01785 [Adhaeribacter sp. BT258]|uniref:Outer membrane protein beta-barrel domain-containing protein n=1 Tax=Adhaeribacter terrigena TaxID=2793070 RepID=A0ABS1BX26_9BACT|nr:hypothetical protein [Adhaeribacter terrigena]MBK0401695.1 hypothetical protein [Adhaeribacter terrigena]